VSYLVGFAAMIQFFSIGTFFTGWVANAAKGADFSLFVGLPVAGVLYWVLSRNLDLEAERKLADAEADELEAEALRHARPEAGPSLA
jgi:purine-cytosine permease-like protein